MWFVFGRWSHALTVSSRINERVWGRLLSLNVTTAHVVQLMLLLFYHATIYLPQSVIVFMNYFSIVSRAAFLSWLEAETNNTYSLFFQLTVNGIIAFDWVNADAGPYNFPLGGNYPCIAVYFSNTDYVCGASRKTGDFFYRFSNGKLRLMTHS